MGIFTPGMFRKRGVVSTTPKEPEVAETPPIVCDVCNGGHDHAECPSVVRPDTLWKTWLSSGTPDRSLRDGDSFDLIADFYARFRGE